MQRTKLLIILFIYIVSFPVYAKYHEEKMNTEDKTVVLDNIKKLIEEYYISPEISHVINNSLHAKKYQSID